MKYTASITITKEINAESPEEARRKAAHWQEEMAGSNDGSEAVANAPLELTHTPTATAV